MQRTTDNNTQVSSKPGKYTVESTDNIYSTVQAFRNGDHSPDTINFLQRQLGNQWLLHQRKKQPNNPIQRYVEVRDYTISNAAPGATVFESQSLNSGGGGDEDISTGYSRTQTRVNQDSTGLEQQKQVYNSANRAWENEGDAEALGPGAGPALKVSTNTMFATEQTSQARYVYMLDSRIGGINEILASQGGSKFVRLEPTGGPSIQVNGKTLVQVQAVLMNRARNEIIHWSQIECQAVSNDVAGKADGRITRGALDRLANESDGPDNERAMPNIGQTYGFRTRPGDTKTNDELGKTLPNRRKMSNKMAEIVAQLHPVFNDVMKGIAVDYSRIGVKAKTFLPGWAEHFETVVAQDGSDRLTLVNYNRTVEKRTEQRRIFVHLMQDQRIFDAFTDYVMNAKEQNPEMTWLHVLTGTIQTFLRDNGDLINAVQAGLAEEINDMMSSNSMDMMYFDMYGSEEQSFHSKYNNFSRGRGGETYTMG